MSIFKKIFGKSGDSESSEDQKPGYPRVDPRHPRVILSALHRIHFSSPEIEQPKKIELSNISVGGMALLHKSLVNPKPGQKLKGDLAIDQESFSLEGVVKHSTHYLLGFEFLNPDRDMQRAIENYLKLEISALSLRPIAEAYLQPDPRGKTVWLNDGKQNEFFGIVDDKGFLTANMSFLGNYLEVERGKGVRCGLVREDDPEDQEPGHKRSSMLELDRKRQPEITELALKFVQNISKLSPEMRKEIEALIKA
jgi:hypothetical protein